MTNLEIFEAVNLIIPIDQKRFFKHFNSSVSEIEGMFSNFVYIDGESFSPLENLKDPPNNNVLPLYHEAIIDNILFLSGKGDFYKGEFIRKAKNAYLKYWNDNSKSKIIKRARW